MCSLKPKLPGPLPEAQHADCWTSQGWLLPFRGDLSWEGEGVSHREQYSMKTDVGRVTSQDRRATRSQALSRPLAGEKGHYADYSYLPEGTGLIQGSSAP